MMVAWALGGRMSFPSFSGFHPVHDGGFAQPSIPLLFFFSIQNNPKKFQKKTSASCHAWKLFGEGKEGKDQQGLGSQNADYRARLCKNGVKGPTRGLHVAVATAFGVLLLQTRYALEIVEANKKRNGSLRASHRLLKNIRRMVNHSWSFLAFAGPHVESFLSRFPFLLLAS